MENSEDIDLEEQIRQWINEVGEDEDNSESDNDIKRLEKRKRQGKKTSNIWDHFKVIDGGDSKHPTPRAACIYCGVDYAADTKRCGTSTLWGHVHRKCKKCPFSEWVVENKKKQASILQFGKSIPSTNVEEEVASSEQVLKFSQKVVREKITSYLVLDELPFRHVNGKGFQKLIKYFFPQFEFPSRFTIGRDINQMFLDEKK